MRDCHGTGWVQKYCLCVFFMSFLVGERNTLKSPPQNRGQSREKKMFTCFSLCVFKCSQELRASGRIFPKFTSQAFPGIFLGTPKTPQKINSLLELGCPVLRAILSNTLICRAMGFWMSRHEEILGAMPNPLASALEVRCPFRRRVSQRYLRDTA